MKSMMRSPITLMALTVFVDFTGFGLIIPLLPFWARHLGANAFGVGLVLTAYALAQFLFTPLLGSLSDRYGRRPVIIVSLAVEACGFALTALAGSLPALMAARFIGGLGASNLGSAQAVVADVTTPASRTRGMGMLGAAIGLGFVVGPAMGGALALHGLTAPFWAAMAVALLNAVLVARFLRETRRWSAPTKTARVRGVGALMGGWRHLGGDVVIARLIAVNLLFTLAFSAMEAVFPLLTLRRFGWGAVQVGYLFTYIGLVVVVMQGGLVGRLVERYGERRLLLGGLALLAFGLALLPVAGSLGVVMAARGLLALGEGAVTPTVTALLSLASPGERQGETLGLGQGVAGLGRILGPLLGGALFATIGTGAPFAAGALLVLVALVLAVPSVLSATRTTSAARRTRGGTLPASVRAGGSRGRVNGTSVAAARARRRRRQPASPVSSTTR
jgi:MFS transporter, DHA1 family, tetracycline resistance protein